MNEMGRSEYYHSQKALDLGDRWLSNPYAYDEAMGAAVRVLEVLRPKGEIVAPRPITLPDGTVLSSRGIGAGTAQARMEYIAEMGRLPETDATGVEEKLIDRLRENLRGDEVASGKNKTAPRGPK
jgi:hypothetical protein